MSTKYSGKWNSISSDFFYKQVQRACSSLIEMGIKKGDKIVTSGGITGIISRVIDNDKIEVEIAENVTVEVIRGTGVQSLMNSQEVKK